MDAANVAASWVSAFVTTVGLASLIVQVGSIKTQLDPFHRLRGKEHLASWGTAQGPPIWLGLPRPPPLGPIIEADFYHCLGLQTIYLSRRPTRHIGSASWTVFLAVFHPHPALESRHHDSPSVTYADEKALDSEANRTTIVSGPLSSQGGSPDNVPWHHRLRKSHLIFYKNMAATEISRSTMIIFILLSQGREVYRHDGASGLRLSYAGYNGYYQLEWPLGEPATLAFQAHESFQGGNDPFPSYFARRSRKCIEMAVGIIDRGFDGHGKSLKTAFAGRKGPGRSLLRLLPKRFGAQRSASDLYNKLGGTAYEVDFLFREQIASSAVVPLHVRELDVPSLDAEKSSVVYLQLHEAEVLADCLDHLPWSALAWSIHRGMKDILVAYALPHMVAYREPLAKALSDAVLKHSHSLRRLGWEANFINDSMAEQASSAILGGERCSGDTCRIVTALTELVCAGMDVNMDQTRFWTRIQTHGFHDHVQEALSPDVITALIKVHLVWWSHDFDYAIYHKLPQRLHVV